MAAAVMVTGGAGFIGANVACALLRRGRDVVVVDDLSTGHREAVDRLRCLSAAGHMLEFVCCRVGDAGQVGQVIRRHRVGTVVHTAGLTSVAESMTQPLRYVSGNVAQSVALIEASIDAGVRGFIFSSSAAVYRPCDSMPIQETSAIGPISVYGTSKAWVEQVLLEAARAHGISYAALRFFNAAGADLRVGLGEDHTPETHLIPRAIDAALRRSTELEIFGDDFETPDGTAERDYVHVCDLGEAHALALDKLEGDAQWCIALNLGGGQRYSVREVLKIVATVTGLAVPVRVCPRRSGDPPRLEADINRAAEVLGWQPEMSSIERMVETAWRWRLANPGGYRKGP